MSVTSAVATAESSGEDREHRECDTGAMGRITHDPRAGRLPPHRLIRDQSVQEIDRHNRDDRFSEEDPWTSPLDWTSTDHWRRPSNAPAGLRGLGVHATVVAAQIFGCQDTLTVFAVVGRRYRDLDLGTSVVPIETRSPDDARGCSAHGPRGDRRRLSRSASVCRTKRSSTCGISFDHREVHGRVPRRPRATAPRGAHAKHAENA